MSCVQTNNRSNVRICLAVTIAALSLSSLSGCGYMQNRHHVIVGAVPDDYRTNHPIILSEREENLDIPVGTSDRRISIAQRGSIQGFVSQYIQNGSGIVQILLPTGSPNASAAERVHSDIVSALRKSGVASGNIITATYSAADVEGTAPIRLSYRAISAGTEPCGKWPEDINETAQNKHYENFGCASQNNLASIVSNPSDLLGPRDLSHIDSAQRAQVISKYQLKSGVFLPTINY
jgi:pilus assembly protein CpaD